MGLCQADHVTAQQCGQGLSVAYPYGRKSSLIAFHCAASKTMSPPFHSKCHWDITLTGFGREKSFYGGKRPQKALTLHQPRFPFGNVPHLGVFPRQKISALSLKGVFPPGSGWETSPLHRITPTLRFLSSHISLPPLSCSLHPAATHLSYTHPV